MSKQLSPLSTPVLIFIVGPTAAGKSEIGMSLAKKLNAEIICCDAMQVYREITIASDKPSAEVRGLIPHHLVDILSVTEDFNMARYRELALPVIQDIQARGKTPLVIGGSGMYMSVLLDGIFEGIAVEEDLREELTEEQKAKGIGFLYGRLKALDKEAANKIHPNDTQRIIRALEVALSTGQSITKLQQKRNGLWGKIPIKIFALNRPREELYQRVETRVDAMFAKGLLEEIKEVSTLPLSITARKIIGIPEIMGHLNGEYDLERAKYLIKLNTRHYVKRQLTWFRREKRLTWIDIKQADSNESVVDQIEALL